MSLLNINHEGHKNIRYDNKENSLLINNSKILLTERESQICYLFLQKSNSYLRIEDIRNALIYNNNEQLEDRAVSIAIHRLKNKIYNQTGYKPIQNRYKKGYIFKDYN